MNFSNLKELLDTYILPSLSAPGNWEKYGQVGDFFGGVVGTIISTITLVVVLGTWLSSKKIDERSRRYQVFTEMLRTHEEIVSSIRPGKLTGRDALSVILSEFYDFYKEVKSHDSAQNPKLSLQQRIDAAYLLTYYGALPNSAEITKHTHPTLDVTDICSKIGSRKRSAFINEVNAEIATMIEGSPGAQHQWRQDVDECFRAIERGAIIEADKKILRSTLNRVRSHPGSRPKSKVIIKAIEGYNIRSEYGGHQNRLSHYFRNLYAAFLYLDEGNFTRREKKALGKILRSKLSNYEQALLAINAISTQGSAWVKSGLIRKYMPIKNVPQHFFTFDPEFDLEKVFEQVAFEWQANDLSNRFCRAVKPQMTMLRKYSSKDI